MLRRFFGVALLFAVSGCFDFNFDDAVPVPYFTATADGTGTIKVKACLLVPFGIFCSGENTHEITASSSSQTIPLARSSFFGTDFSGELLGNGVGQTIVFSWTGFDGLVGPSSAVQMPPPFEILEPAEGAVFAPGESVHLAWTGPTGGLMRVNQNVTCSSSSLTEFSDESFIDTGELDIKASSFSSSEECQVELELLRVQEGDVDPVFSGGSIEGQVVRRVNVVVGPQ